MLTTYNCPICQSILVSQVGDQAHLQNPEFGIILYCQNRQCSAQEVMGHGNKEKDAYQVILDKFVPRRTKSD